MDKKEKEFWKDMYTMATVGLNIVIATFIGLGLGLLLDRKFFPWAFHWNSTPIFTLVFLLIGIIAGFKNVFMMTKGKLDKIEDDKGRPKGDFKDKDSEDKDT